MKSFIQIIQETLHSADYKEFCELITANHSDLVGYFETAQEELSPTGDHDKFKAWLRNYENFLHVSFCHGIFNNNPLMVHIPFGAYCHAMYPIFLHNKAMKNLEENVGEEIRQLVG